MTIVPLLILFVGSLFAQSSSTPQVAKGPTPKASAPTGPPAKTAAPSPVDLNSASKQALMALGITDASAQKIIANRPYHAKTDLTGKKIIPEDVYAKISSRIVARTTNRVSPGNVERKAASSKDTDTVKKFQ
jgi:DNA uptake protein ComE-like DNA-binding protein